LRKTWELLPDRYREVALTVAGLLVVLIFTQLLPSATSAGRGLPTALLFQALITGIVNALTAAALVLVYRTTRILNFAQTAIGAGGAVLCFDLLNLDGAPFLLALPLGLLTGAALGAAFDLIFGRRFLNSPRLVLTVLTIVSAGFLGSTGQSLIDNLPIFPPAALRTIDQQQGSYSLGSLLPFPNWHFTIGDLLVPFGFPEIFGGVAAIVALAALIGFLRYTRLGVALRAVSENTERAALLGISVGLLSTIVWTIAGLLSALSLTLTGFMGKPSAAFGYAPALLLPAFAAAVLGRFRSLGVAAAAAIGISEATAAVVKLQPDAEPLISLALLIITAAGLLLQGRRQARSDEGITSAWAATEELRPVPKEMLALTPLRITRWGLVAAAAAALIAYPFISDTGQTFLMAVIFLNAIIGLSLVVLTGWAGQVSLGQFGFAAIGAVLAAALAQRWGITFWVAVPVASLVTAGIAILIGLPALRIPGLYLAVATFAFAIAVHDVLFSEKFFGWLLPTTGLTRPQLFLIDFDDERAMYFLCAIALAVSILAVVNLRRGRFGRVIIGVRENEANASSVAIPVLRVKLAAFGLAGLLAGFAGAIFAFQQRTLTADSFSGTASIQAFVQVVIGGISSVWGPVLGSGYVNGINFVLSGTPEIATVLVSVAPLLLLYMAPGGLLSLFAKIRDAALRIIAQRNQLIVPSLFADMDPEALHLRLIPLAAPVPGSGTQAAHRKYRMWTSRLALKVTGASAEQQALTAALEGEPAG